MSKTVVYLISAFLLLISVWAHAEDVQYISFTSNRTGNFDIYIIDTNGENLRNLTDRRTNEAYATWAPNGRFFAYHSDQNRHLDIYVMNVETKEIRRLTKDPGNDLWPAWSPDGRWIAFASDRSGAFEIYKMDVHGKNLQRLTRLPGSNMIPAWSPDSQWIAFWSQRRGEKRPKDAALHVMKANGDELRLLTRAVGGIGGSGAWSPDGKGILFSTTRKDAKGESTLDLFVINPNGQERRQLTQTHKWVLESAWSFDGRWIAFGAREPHQNVTNAIYVMNVASGELRQLTDDLSMYSSPAWVPVRSALSVQPHASFLTTLWGKLKQR